MPDPGFLSGFTGICMNMAVQGILDHINIAVRCKKELNSLGVLVKRIEPTVCQIQQYCLTLDQKKGIQNEASPVNQWLQKLDALLKQGSAMAQDCIIPRVDFISRYRTSIRITDLISKINQYLDWSPLMSWESVQGGFEVQLGEIKESI